MSFEEIGLPAELLRAIAAQGYTSPTPIQAKAIPIILDNNDVLAGAQTGTGKSAAFTLPMLQLLNRNGSRRQSPRALVLTPTRELAAQVGESVSIYGRHLSLRSTVIFGGVGIKPQIDCLRRGVDIVVATPGRLLDYAGQGTVDLSGIEMLVLDEADRMLDMGFIHDINRVLKLLPPKRQKLLKQQIPIDTLPGFEPTWNLEEPIPPSKQRARASRWTKGSANAGRRLRALRSASVTLNQPTQKPGIKL